MTEKELERSIGRVVLHQGHLIVAADPAGRVTYVNRLFTAITGWEPGQVTGRQLEELIAGGDGAEARDRLLQSVRAGREWRGELKACAKDGGTYWELAVVSPVRGRGGKVALLLKVSEDITERKLMEEELITARDQAERAVHARSEFIANMSHEIRTPIHAIIGNSDLLLDTSLNEEQREYTETMRYSANVLLTLINDVLDFSKIESGKLEPESIRFDACEVVEEAVGLVALEGHKKGLEIVTFYPDMLPHLVKGDQTRLRQVILNLANNAVKFTDAGEVAVTVELASEEQEAVTLRFTVRDTGIGIAAPRIPRLFQAFTQLDSSTTRRYGGTGLGLAISRRLVELMGGRIGVESKEGAGSSFSFTARFGKQELADSYSAVRRDFFGGMPVLVVEDNATARRVLVEYLKSWGCETTEASNAEEALRVLRERSGSEDAFRVALIDMRLPGMDGWQLAGEVNADAAINATRLILLTPYGSGAEEAKMKLLKWFDDYLAKPVKKSALLETLFRVAEGEMELEVAEEVAEGAAPESHPASFRVLVAEDNEASQQLFTAVLRKMGHSLEIAQNGKEAVEKAVSMPFDVIFMDVHMPVMSGMEAAREIRAAGRTMPIIAVTASGAIEDEMRCRESGMDDFISKPFRTQDVSVLLSRWVAPRGGSTTLAAAPEAAPAMSAEISPAARPLDFEDALDAFAGEREMLTKAIAGFIRRAEEAIPRMERALDARDLDSLAFEAHAIKGGALNLRANGLGAAAARLEGAARKGDEAGCANGLGELKNAFARLEDFIS